jgi:hypothetical protein
MIIGISGKKGVGKDLVGSIIQYLTLPNHDQTDFDTFLKVYAEEEWDSPFIIKKFADSLKDMVCMLLSCTREQLEDHYFKNQVLGDEWTKYKLEWGEYHFFSRSDSPEWKEETFSDKKTAEYYRDEILSDEAVNVRLTEVNMTPRELLQLLGTECGREILHPNIWVNALMSGYTSTDTVNLDGMPVDIYPNWIITDCRFPNEKKAIEDTDGGIVIRVNRRQQFLVPGVSYSTEGNHIIQHASETALDDAEFDYVIDNNGSMKELYNNVEKILQKEMII